MIIGALCRQPGQPDTLQCVRVDDDAPMLELTLWPGQTITLHTGVVAVMSYANGTRCAMLAGDDEKQIRHVLSDWEFEEAHP